MNYQSYFAFYKGRLKESHALTFEIDGQSKHMDPQFCVRALMRPTKLHQSVIVRTVTTSSDKHVTDIICRWGDEQSVVVMQVASTSDRLLPDVVFIDIDGQGVFELNVSRLNAYLKRLLDANVKVRLWFKQSDREFSISSFEPLLPDILEGTFFYDEQRYKMGGKRAVLGAFSSTCGVYENLPCKMMLATLTESSVFSHLTEGFCLDAKVKWELDEDGESLIVKELTLPTYPDVFEAEIISATLIEKDKTTDNLLVCEFFYFKNLVSRVNITNKKLDVMSVEESVSFKANLSFNSTDKFKFTFLELAMPTPFNAKVTPKELEPYPSEFEFLCFGLVIKVRVKEDSWEQFEKSKEQILYSGVSVPSFELDKEFTLPVTYWQAKKDPGEHNAWSPKVTFYLNRLSLPEVIEDTLSYVTSEYRNGHLYYLFRLGEVDMHYPVLAAEFFLYGIGGFSKDTSIDLRLEKYSRFNKKTKKEYKGEHPRGSKCNEWSVQVINSPLPIFMSNASDIYQKAYCLMEWGADVELMQISNEYWSSFSTQRRNFAYCALTEHGGIYPLVALPPVLMRENNCFRLGAGQEIKVNVGSVAVQKPVQMKDDLPQWRWAKALKVKSPSEGSKIPTVKLLTCIAQQEIEPISREGQNRNKYLQLKFHDNEGTEYIYNSFKLDTYPLEDSDLERYEHIALCTGKDRVVEIIEMVKKNEK